MADNIFDFRPDQAEHDRYGDLSALGTPGIDVHPLAAVICDDRNGFLVPHTQFREAVSETARPLVPFLERIRFGLVLPSQSFGIV